eukprot:5279592-Pyramimonas_sp.AAC.1
MGLASSQSKCRPQRADSGRRLRDILSQYGTRALNTFGLGARRGSAWRNPDGQGETRIDYIATPRSMGPQDFASAIRETPLAPGPSRDHMIVEAS